MKGILRFAVNVPTRVALRFDQGKRVEGRYGHQVMYSLADERVMYVPPVVAQRIEELAIGPGEPFEIIREEVKSGTRKMDRVAGPKSPAARQTVPELVRAAAADVTLVFLEVTDHPDRLYRRAPLYGGRRPLLRPFRLRVLLQRPLDQPFDCGRPRVEPVLEAEVIQPLQQGLIYYEMQERLVASHR